MKIIKSSIFLFSIATTVMAQQPGKSVQFDQNTFTKDAERYGNKAANLIELKKIAQGLRAQGVRVFVPAIFPLSHEEIARYVQNKLGDYIEKSWVAFTEKQKGNPVLTDAARPVLEEVRRRIQEAFTNETITLSPERRVELNTFLQDNRKKLLMVRSTGREDTATLANAGGNESIAAVLPDLASVSVAIGKVVASYFSDKSISQRLLAGDSTIFDKPFMPVLLQVMVGELSADTSSAALKIPTSGVMFSQEAEANTTGVVQIQATWGHGEAVVNGLLPVDTFYIGSSDIIHPVILFKKLRLAPVNVGGKARLGELPNPAALVKAQSLTNKNVFVLKKTAEEIQRYYGRPMDTEFVVQEGRVYLVQTRPIVRQEIKASYLTQEFVDGIAKDDNVLVDVIGAGGGAVRTISGNDQIMVNDNIRDALDFFLKNSQQEKIQCIVVGEMAPATSHEATTFRGANKPVLYFKNLELVRQWVGEGSLVIDPQRGMIVRLRTQQPAIAQGWFSHPIPMLLSLVSGNIKKLTQEEQFDCKEFFKEPSRRKLIDVIKNGSVEDAQKALCTVLARAWSQVSLEGKKLAGHKVDAAIVDSLKALFGHLLTSAYEVKLSLSLDRLQRLYAIKFLEAIMYQWPQPLEIVHNYSFASVLKTGVEERAISKKLTTVDPFTIQFAKLAPFALTDAVKNDWEKFVKNLEQGGKQQLAQLIFKLIKLDAASLWINTSFAFAWRETNGDAKRTLMRLEKEQKQIEEFLKTLLEQQGLINALVISQWEDQEKFESQYKQLKTILDYFTSEGFRKEYERTIDFGKNVALVVMKLLVDRFDVSIKTLESSRSYANERTRVNNFKKLIDRYFDLYSAWIDLPTIQTGGNQLAPYESNSVNDHRARVQQIKQSAKEILLPTPGVNVAGAALGSRANFNRSIQAEVSLEDVFSIIHQSLLNMIAYLSSTTNISVVDTPKAILVMQKILAQTIRPPRGVMGNTSFKLVGVSFEKKEVVYYYNLPLQNHSALGKLVYNMIDGTVVFTIEFVGQARQRWALMYFVAFVSRLSGFKFPEGQNPQLDTERGRVAFAWELGSDAKMIEKLPIHDYLTRCVLVSFFNENRGDTIVGIFSPLINVRQLFSVVVQLQNKTRYQKELLPIFLKIAFDAVGSEEGLQEKGYQIALELAAEGLKDSNRRLLALSLYQMLVHKGQGMQEAIAVGKTVMKTHLLAAEYLSVLNLFQILVEHDKGFDQAIEAASEGIRNNDETIQRKALALFESLFERKQGFKEATQIIREGIKNHAIAALATLLVNEGQGLDEVIRAASIGINSEDVPTQFDALALFKSLFVKKEGFKEAKQAALKAVEFTKTQSIALQLFDYLVENDQAFEEAKQAIVALMARQPINTGIIDLLKSLVAKGQAYDEAEQMALQGIKQDEQIMTDYSVQLLTNLIVKGRGFEAAEKVASKKISGNSDEKSVALRIFKALLKKDKSLSYALQAAEEGIKDEDVFVRSEALELFQQLVEKDQDFDQATKAALKGMSDSDLGVQVQALQTLGALVQKNQSFGQAAQAALAGSKNQKTESSAEELFQLLFAKEQGFDEAGQAIVAAVKRNQWSLAREARLLKALKSSKTQNAKDALKELRKSIAGVVPTERTEKLIKEINQSE